MLRLSSIVRSVVERVCALLSFAFVDQAVSSGSNALTLSVAAILLPTEELNNYAIAQLVVMSIIGVQRALISEPGMVLSGSLHSVDAIRSWSVIIISVDVACAGGAWMALGRQSAVLVLCACLPLVQDMLRYRGFNQQQAGRVLISDSVWAGGMVLALALGQPRSGDGAFLIWSVTSAPGIIPLLLLPRDRRRDAGGLRSVLTLGRFGVADVLIGSTTSLLPLILVNAIRPASSVGAFRFAQTASGPVNVFASFLVINMLMHAQKVSAESNEALTRRMAKLVNNVTVGVASYFIVVGALVATYVHYAGPSFGRQLYYAYPVTAFVAILTSRSMAYVAVLRATAQQRRGVAVRLLILLSNAAGLGLGIVASIVSGADPLVFSSIVTGFATIFAWRRAFGRYLSVR